MQPDACSCKSAQAEANAMLQDKLIGKRVLTISGTVPAANYVQLPKHRSHSLGLHGRYLYMQVR
jgi:Protein of unknown function (DUF667)